ncbi:unnamed protein product [Taenia asiatica]|uniref:cyclin-dependent kinase n=1 Tax=Taenia asiatica TaxID=60517 RepID=A0A0R3VZL6_TAEAS|nr:unnamed protein product [Taenia asiatica]
MDLNYKDTGMPPDTVKAGLRLCLFLIQSCMYQMLQALCYCHVRRIIHRDLKPENVLVDVNRGVVKLADFSMARSFGYPPRAFTHEVVTLLYRAPEILLGEAVYCCGVDVWSMGCMFAVMATGDPAFCDNSEIDQLYQIFRMKETPTEKTWPSVAKLPNYSPTSFPSWHSNRLCSQERIVRALDARGLDLLTMNDHCVPPSPLYFFLLPLSFQFHCCVQESMQLIDKSLCALLRYDPPSRINAQQALLHPHFADFDKRSLPAVGEKYVGLPIGKIPPDFAELFNALINIDESGLEGEGKE